MIEHSVLPEAVKKANIDYRRKRAHTWILSYFIASGFDFSEIPESYKQEFKIDEFHYLKVLHEASGRY